MLIKILKNIHVIGYPVQINNLMLHRNAIKNKKGLHKNNDAKNPLPDRESNCKFLPYFYFAEF